jgi:ketosteroid isomerase-like protein
MMHQGAAAEGQIRALIEAWADAVRRHDMPGILAHHQPDVVMFDVPPPLQSRGLDEYEKTWDLFFKYHKPSQTFDIEELAIVAGEDVAFAVAIMRCVSDPPEAGGFPFRLTIGLRKVDGDWRIASIELRRDLVRAVNYGPTTWIDATGRIVAEMSGDAPGVLATHPALIERPPTLYARWGEWPLTVLLAVMAFLTRKGLVHAPARVAATDSAT